MNKNGQSRALSALESVANVAVGFVLSFALQRILMSAYGLNTTAAVDLQITLAFTVLSLARSYGMRRLSNRFGGALQRRLDRLTTRTA